MSPALWYEIENATEVETPALVLYPDRIQGNIERMLSIAGGPERLCPHIKTHKLPQLVQMQRDAGIRQFKCATIAEAEMLASAGAQDVLLAYPVVGPNMKRLAQLVTQFPTVRFAALADDARAVEAISTTMSAAGQTVDLLLDLDIGMGRSGIPPGPEALAICKQIAGSQGLRFAGLHAYDGHIRERDPSVRAAAVDAAMSPVFAFREELERAGLEPGRLIAGGTPTFAAHARHRNRTYSPGTCVLWDAAYSTKYPDLGFQHSAAVLTRVVSKPTADRVCLDLGFKAVAPDNPDPRVVLFGLEDAKTIWHSEEHLTVQSPSASNYRSGDVLVGIPWHICPTCALHQRAVIVRDNRVVDYWTIVARDRRLSI